MSAHLQGSRRSTDQGDQHGRTPTAPRPAGADRRESILLLCVLALIATACLPLFRVYANGDFINPVAAAVLVPLGMAWAGRRSGLGTLTTGGFAVAGWALFVGLVFLPDSLRWGLLPTWRTWSEGLDLAQQGILLAQTRPSPVIPEPGLLLLTVSGVWAIALIVEGLVFRARSPLKAIVVAITMWAVPLSMAPDATVVWPWAVPLLGASALLLLFFAGSDVGRWGTWVASRNDHGGTAGNTLAPTGWFMAAGAIALGSMFASSLPGFGEPPWYDLRGRGGTTLTANPIVQLRANLTARDTGPLFRVTTTQPVYLRSTALDVYDENEQWTSSGILGRPVSGGSLGPSGPLPEEAPFPVDVEVAGLDGAVLVPAPYDPLGVDGPLADSLQFDPSTATFTLGRGETLDTGDTYTMLAAGRTADPDRLAASDSETDAFLTALPANVPAEVEQMANQIVDEAGVDGQFAQALAIQEELRSWTYSLTPPQGHSSAAMRAFLETRTGYCEQFAGTMAVMLRSLGIPARVATGFTPGQIQAPDGTVTPEQLTDEEADLYVVSWANAHAWVEVLFPGGEWVPFEPTPRADGNVLVPTPGTVAPNATVAQLAGTDMAMNPASAYDQQFYQPYQDDFMRGEVGGLGDVGAVGDAARRSPTTQVGRLLAATALVALALLVTVALRSRAVTRRATSPLQRILLARRRVGYLGRAVGIGAHPSETEREYLRRLAVGTDARRAAETLADVVTQAHYAPRLREDAASLAEGSEVALTRGLTGHRSPLRRELLRAQGRMAIGWDALWRSLSTWTGRLPRRATLRRAR